MPAATVRIQGELLEALYRLKPAGETLASVVRELLESEIRRRRMARAALDYSVFLAAHPAETEELGNWAAAPLERDSPPRPGPKRARKL
jgi:predicted CopG family antitoxin